MGLDISAYSNVEEVVDIEKYDEDALYDFYYTGNNGAFLIQLGKLKKDTYYRISLNSKYHSFRAGSYGGYNNWRKQLAVMAGYGSVQNVWNDFNNDIRYHKLKKIQNEDDHIKPFYLIINFSDCEGFIGPDISKKLYMDFVNFDEKAKEQDEYFYNKYCEWKEAFRIASEYGFVIFG